MPQEKHDIKDATQGENAKDLRECAQLLLAFAESIDDPVAATKIMRQALEMERRATLLEPGRSAADESAAEHDAEEEDSQHKKAG
jgi:hypothetical protein